MSTVIWKQILSGHKNISDARHTTGRQMQWKEPDENSPRTKVKKKKKKKKKKRLVSKKKKKGLVNHDPQALEDKTVK